MKIYRNWFYCKLQSRKGIIITERKLKTGAQSWHEERKQQAD